MMWKMELYILMLCLVLPSIPALSERYKRQGDYCYTPDNFVRLCTPYLNCPALLQLYINNEASPEVLEYLKQSQLRCEIPVARHHPIICCSIHLSNYHTLRAQPFWPFLINPIFTYYPTENYHHLHDLHPINIDWQPQPQLPNNVSSTVELDPNTDQQQTEVATTTDSVPEQDGPPATITNETLPMTQETESDHIQATEDQEKQLEFRANKCANPDGKQGSCVLLQECPEFFNRLKANPADTSFMQLLRSSNRACKANAPIICCPEENGPDIVEDRPDFKASKSGLAKLPTPEEGCGQSKVTHKKIVGGSPSRLASWPWITLLGYKGPNGIAFRCGGSLITNRHVVTAAHCYERSLQVVRLGEHDLATDTETQHIDVNIVRSACHTEYSKTNGRNDIAVLYLARDVKFTSKIVPICIPDKENFEPRSLVGHTPFVAGWGYLGENTTTLATVLQEIQLPVLENSECEKQYQAQNLLKSANQFDETVLCAAVLIGGKDTCWGDSGGPLMLPKKLNPKIFYYNLIGVISYGIGCARENAPGIYANVRYFSDWIKQKIAEPI